LPIIMPPQVIASSYVIFNILFIYMEYRRVPGPSLSFFLIIALG
jgi:hypothetical protein